MTFQISRVAEADLLDLAHIHYAAFQPGLPMLWYRRPSDKSFEILAMLRKPRLSDPKCYLFKAVEKESGAVVGFASWVMHEEGYKEAEKNEGEKEDEDPPVEEINWPGTNSFKKALDRARAETLGTQPTLLLGTLVVDPKYQRKGIGNLLMQWGVDEADKRGLMSYLESSPAGRGLYEKFGYKTVKDAMWDTRPWGGDFVDTHYIMIRPRKDTTQN